MKKTLLIVEDNLILCDILERWLQKAGYRVLTAIDEPSARRKIKGNNVALVLTDVRLPEGDGISLLEWSISQGLHIPFVVMTEHASRNADTAAQGITGKSVLSSGQPQRT